MTAETNPVRTVTYLRMDLQLTIFERNGALLVGLNAAGAIYTEINLDRKQLLESFAQDSAQPLTANPFYKPVENFLQKWYNPLLARLVVQPGQELLSRVVVQIAVPELVALGWEGFLQRILNSTSYAHLLVIRGRNGQAVSQNYPFSPPLRIVRYTFERTLDTPDLPTFIDEHIFYGMLAEQREKVVEYKQFADPSSRLLGQLVREKNEFEILHLSGFRSAPNLSVPGLQFGHVRGSTSRQPDMNAADLQALATATKLRLLILQVNNQDAATYQGCLQLAQTLLDKIGLSVLVVNLGAESSLYDYFRSFYDALVHDSPLDVARQRANNTSNSYLANATAFFADAPAEEALRFSNLIRAAQLLRQNLLDQLKKLPLKYRGLIGVNHPATDFLTNLQNLVEMPLDQLFFADPDGGDNPPDPLEDQVRDLRFSLERDLQNVGQALDWQSESRSSVPLITDVARLQELTAEIEKLERNVARTAGQIVPPEIPVTNVRKDGGWLPKLETISSESQLVAEPAPPDRYVNSWLESNSQPSQKLKPRQRLWPEKSYRLRINIGQADTRSEIKNPELIPPEYLLPADRSGGDWLHVAVYSLDFRLADSEIEPGTTSEGREARQFARVIKPLWLPAYGSSKPVYFEITPVRGGLVFLRIGIYYRNQLLQSLRLEASIYSQASATLANLSGISQRQLQKLEQLGLNSWAKLAQTEPASLVLGSTIKLEAAQNWVKLAQAVAKTESNRLREIPGLSKEQAGSLEQAQITDLATLAKTGENRLGEISRVDYRTATYWRRAAAFLGKTGYSLRTEYTISPKLLSYKLPPRAVTIFTNRVQDKIAIGVKAGSPDLSAIPDSGWTEAEAPNPVQVARILETARTALDEISTWRAGSRPVYQFAQQDDPQGQYVANQGKPETLKTGLIKLAKVGYGLTTLLPAAADRKLRTELAAPGQRVHIARVAEGEILPWALYYDYDLNPGADLDVCLTDIDPKSSGLPVPRNCGGGAHSCPNWNSDGEMVCPWGFWGFRHIIEQPPQLVREGGAPRELVQEIKVSGSPQVLLNVNASLKKLATHLQNLVSLPEVPDQMVYAGDTTARTLPHLLQTPVTEVPRKQVLEALKSNDPQLIYFYCHAGETDKIIQGLPIPYLSFGSDTKNFIWEKDVERYARSPWSYHPLIFLNGCESAAANPKTLGSFIQTFAELGAAGVIGTEIEVWEDLATVVAEKFLADFLTGKKSVGEILRDIRLALLKIYNPLGLIYTAYCSADLKLLP